MRISDFKLFQISDYLGFQILDNLDCDSASSPNPNLKSKSKIEYVLDDQTFAIGSGFAVRSHGMRFSDW